MNGSGKFKLIFENDVKRTMLSFNKHMNHVKIDSSVPTRENKINEINSRSLGPAMKKLQSEEIFIDQNFPKVSEMHRRSSTKIIVSRYKIFRARIF